MERLKRIKNDLQSFADTEEDVIIQPDGQVLFTRLGKDYELKINDIDESLYINFEGRNIKYQDFISKEIAQLDIFATRLIQKRKNIEPFIEGPSNLITPWSTTNGIAIKQLQKECDEALLSGTKITFITADAGHGKSALLKEFQIIQANRFLKGESNYLFWHVDLQGRDLVRLAEAIMYDLGELRIRGLYYSSILTLIKNRNIILAIDGFDELAAEIGGESALGSLSSLVKEMDGRGTLIAASRRTFFNTQDYLKRTEFLKGYISHNCFFYELKVLNWRKENATEYISYFCNDQEKIYSHLIENFKDESHPILARPFLLSKIVQLIDSSDEENSLKELLDEMNKDKEGVTTIVESFIKREVQKWKDRDKVTGQPYLNFNQHLSFLATIAKEMWESQKDYISIDEIELYGTMLIDDWDIEESLRATIIRMLHSHALLVPISIGSEQLRKFDHEEFKNFFLGKSLGNLIKELSLRKLKKFLFLGQLPDSVPRYMLNTLKKNDIKKYLDLFQEIIDKEWKPTHIQSNVGTIIPYLIDNNTTDDILSFSGKVTYSSLGFENKFINNVVIKNGNFINISLKNVKLKNVIFDNCSFNEIKFDLTSSNVFEEVIISNSNIDSIQIINNDEIIETAYSPIRIKDLLHKRGIRSTTEKEILVIKKHSVFKTLVNKFLSKYHRTILQYESNWKEHSIYGSSTKMIIEDVIPFLLENEIISEFDNKNIKQSGSKAYRLNYDLKDLLKADSDSNENKLKEFWDKVNKR
ncbi:hypothetical protein BW723_16520 [Polaribacter reichenbachii]|uniref:NACHT domain-containing protein n=1 Tax=Polaribacter reichenbachii TaxID=996801 RepID=A0A1B8TRA7_9FLAO|nr:hypothetical protein [Polaribacter reichenbachii]APZ47801.1 hypothetical protein BW723_16520 [Polaribacter reichenbachii]AUC18436.1 hypothetical protein BTO17_06940 [Polaribacter reichenbachii]OBY62213.1 hypothetical protein LPB301_15125 [Polaribacter reichenbachii]